MTNQEIFELMERFEKSGLSALRITDKDFSVEMEKQCISAVHDVPVKQVRAAEPVQDTVAEDAENGSYITSPLVGTFYAAPSPGSEPYVKPGDKVSAGQTVCLVEAMKMMNEIPAPCDCIIEEAVQQDGAFVPFGEALFRYRAI